MKERKSSNRVVAETTEKKTKVEKKRAELASLGQRDLRRKRPEKQSELAILLCHHSLASWPTFLEEMCRGDELVAENLYAVFTFEPLHSLRLGVRRLLKLCLVHYLSSDESSSCPGSPAERQETSG